MLGLIEAPSGLGESARTCYRALEAMGQSPYAFDLTKTFNPLYDGMLTELEGAEGGQGEGPLIMHLNPPECLGGLFKAGARSWFHRYRIGVWHWELPVAPTSWGRPARYFNEIWVPSRFVADSLRRLGTEHIRVVPHPVETVTVESDPEAFGLPQDRFKVLCMFDLNSSLARKNPVGAIKAFQKAFGEDDDALLVLKVSGADMRRAEFAILKAVTDGIPNVRIMTDTLSHRDIRCLLASCQVRLSLHRAEGFGLTLAEAMRQGTPCVATGWSGNLDFMTPENSCLVGYSLVEVPRQVENYGGLGGC